MEIIDTASDLRARLDRARCAGRTIGFAPTMGALHDGHRSLMAAAAQNHHVSVMSIFVNPLQFAPDEDLDAYPRMLDADIEMATGAGVDFAFVPSAAEMYPVENWTTVSVRVVTEPWEGTSRPTHLAGVSTVVAKLFNIVGPCSAYFGEKDYQQLATVRRMVVDLNQPVEVVGMPTIREEDGLAMSSRNLRLSADQRQQAPVLSRALRSGIAMIDLGETDPSVVEAVIRAELATASLADEPDYVAVVDADTLVVPDELAGDVRVMTAMRFGDVRLIDNMGTTLL